MAQYLRCLISEEDGNRLCCRNGSETKGSKENNIWVTGHVVPSRGHVTGRPHLDVSPPADPHKALHQHYAQ